MGIRSRTIAQTSGFVDGGYLNACTCRAGRSLAARRRMACEASESISSAHCEGRSRSRGGSGKIAGNATGPIPRALGRESEILLNLYSYSFTPRVSAEREDSTRNGMPPKRCAAADAAGEADLGPDVSEAGFRTRSQRPMRATCPALHSQDPPTSTGCGRSSRSHQQWVRFAH